MTRPQSAKRDATNHGLYQAYGYKNSKAEPTIGGSDNLSYVPTGSHTKRNTKKSYTFSSQDTKPKNPFKQRVVLSGGSGKVRNNPPLYKNYSNSSSTGHKTKKSTNTSKKYATTSKVKSGKAARINSTPRSRQSSTAWSSTISKESLGEHSKLDYTDMGYEYQPGAKYGPKVNTSSRQYRERSNSASGASTPTLDARSQKMKNPSLSRASPSNRTAHGQRATDYYLYRGKPSSFASSKHNRPSSGKFPKNIGISNSQKNTEQHIMTLSNKNEELKRELETLQHNRKWRKEKSKPNEHNSTMFYWSKQQYNGKTASSSGLPARPQTAPGGARVPLDNVSNKNQMPEKPSTNMEVETLDISMESQSNTGNTVAGSGVMALRNKLNTSTRGEEKFDSVHHGTTTYKSKKQQEQRITIPNEPTLSPQESKEQSDIVKPKESETTKLFSTVTNTATKQGAENTATSIQTDSTVRTQQGKADVISKKIKQSNTESSLRPKNATGMNNHRIESNFVGEKQPPTPDGGKKRIKKSTSEVPGKTSMHLGTFFKNLQQMGKPKAPASNVLFEAKASNTSNKNKKDASNSVTSKTTKNAFSNSTCSRSSNGSNRAYEVKVLKNKKSSRPSTAPYGSVRKSGHYSNRSYESTQEQESERGRLRRIVSQQDWDGVGQPDMYVFGKLLGQGSFGTVRLAHHKITGHKVAVKIYEKSKMKDPGQFKRCKQEIYLMQRLNHPHTICLFETFETSKRIHLVMEASTGGNLCSYVKQHKWLTEKDATRILHQIVSAVEYLHEKRIVHRDIKLENVLFDSNRNMKLVDYGFSVLAGEKQLKVFCGTPSYMAPEIVKRKEYRGFPVDIWSLGVLFYAMLCGCFPFTAKTYPELYKKILRGVFHIPDKISSYVRDLLRKMMTLDPLRRLTIHQVRQHPVLHQSNLAPIMQNGDCLHLIPDNPERKIDETLVKQLVSFGFDRELLETSIVNKQKNHYSTSYYLLCMKTAKKRQRLKLQQQKASAQGKK